MEEKAYNPEAGSCLTLNDDLKEIRAALNDARRLLGEINAGMGKHPADGNGTLTEAFKAACAAFGAAQSGFKAIADFDRDIKSIIREALPITYRKRTELNKRKDDVSSLTDEGYARALVNVQRIADPYERMDALIRFAAIEKWAMEKIDANADRLLSRQVYHSETKVRSATNLEDKAIMERFEKGLNDKKRIHGLRIKTLLDLFFSTRKEIVKAVSDLSDGMSTAMPSDYELSREVSLRHDIVRYLESIKSGEERFRDPSGTVSRTGRRVRRRGYSMPSSLCCSAQIGV